MRIITIDDIKTYKKKMNLDSNKDDLRHADYNKDYDQHDNNSKINQNKVNKDNEYSIEEFDQAKTKVLKYLMYKKRTENEVRVKFAKDINQDLLEDVIEELKQLRIYK